MFLFVSSIMMSVLYNKFVHYPDNSISCVVLDELPCDKPIVVFGSGAGYWSYYLGIAKFMQETYKVDDINFLGVSAGTISCLGLVNKVPIDIVFMYCIEHIRLLNQNTFGC